MLSCPSLRLIIRAPFACYVREKKEQEEKTRKAEEDTNKLFQYWSEEQLETEEYDKALDVYGADYQTLDDNDRRIKKLTHDLLDGKISISNYGLSLRKISWKTKEVSPEKEMSEPAVIEKEEVPVAEDTTETVDDFTNVIVDEETKAAREAAEKIHVHYRKRIEGADRDTSIKSAGPP